MGKLLVIFGLFSCLRCLADDAPTSKLSPHALALKIVTSYQKSGENTVLESNLTNSIEFLENGAKKYPADYLLPFALAACYMQQTNSEAAELQLHKAYLISEKEVNVAMMYAYVVGMNKRPSEAYEIGKEELKLHPKKISPIVKYAIAERAFYIQKYDDCENLLKEMESWVANNAPTNKSALFYSMLGNCYLYKADYTNAIICFNKGLTYSPNRAPLLTSLGEAYLKSGHLKKACTYLDESLVQNTNFCLTQYYRGICYEKLHNKKMAQSYFEKAYASTKETLHYNGKQYLQYTGQNYFYMYLICEKLSKAGEAKDFKEEANQLGYAYEAPWKK